MSDTPSVDIIPVGANSKTMSIGTVTASTILTVTLELPDGTTTDIKLSPTAATGISTFSIGSSAEATAQNITAALTSQIKYHSQVELTGAVSQQASLEFFKGSLNHPPRRVKGTPPETATEFETDPSIITGSTLIWYTGTDDDSDPRMDKSSQVTDHVITGTGARANEIGFVETLAYTALMALGNFSEADQNVAADQFSDLRDRTRKGLGTANEDLNEMKASVGSARASIKSANDDMVAQKNIMESILSDIENASPEKTAILLSNMQTSLQVMYQVTAKLSSLSLANYL